MRPARTQRRASRPDAGSSVDGAADPTGDGRTSDGRTSDGRTSDGRTGDGPVGHEMNRGREGRGPADGEQHRPQPDVSLLDVPLFGTDPTIDLDTSRKRGVRRDPDPDPANPWLWSTRGERNATGPADRTASPGGSSVDGSVGDSLDGSVGDSLGESVGERGRASGDAGGPSPDPAAVGSVGPRAPQRPEATVDWAQVVSLRKEASELITDQTQDHLAETGRPMPAEDRLLMGRAVIRRVVGDHVRTLHRAGEALWSPETEQAYTRATEDAVFGFGRMQPLFDLPDVENIEIHGWDSVVVQYGDGHREQLAPVADSDDELVDAIRFLGENANPSRPFDDTHPTMTLALGNRFRLHAIGFGLSFRPSIVIRQHTLTDVSLSDLARGGLMPPVVAQFLDAAVLARKSIVISGDQGAGKTTLLRALINAIPRTERFGTLETDYELMTHLQPGRENIVALQSRIGHGERDAGEALGNVSVADLMPEALRQNLSRLIVGEVRGGEAAAMFEAMQAGAGTLSTTHSHSASSTMDRLASRVAQGGVLTIDEAYRQIAHNIDLFVYVRLVDDTWKGGLRRRFISEIRQLTGAIEADRPVTHLTYLALGTARDPAGFFPDADFAADLATFFRPLPGGADLESARRDLGDSGVGATDSAGGRR